MSQSTAEFYLGRRLSYTSQLCTVRYIGPVTGTQGTWLGVEWDDPTRGKHSGTHNGTTYFTCVSSSATAASFVRPQRKHDEPRNFIEALRAKYAADEEFKEEGVSVEFVVEKPGGRAPNQPIRISGKEVEEVGFDKIWAQLSQLGELKYVILDGMRIARPEARLREGVQEWPVGMTDVKDVCPKVIELDLSRNLIEEWREVAAICEQLEKLKSLRVDGTRFRDASVTPAERDRSLKAFANITTLKLEEILLPWEDLTRITHLFPSLTTLSASSNHYTSLPSPLAPTQTITNLTLEDNHIPSLSSISSLTSLPNLRHLVLKSNQVSTITSSPTEPTPIFSTTLTTLDLSYNAISSWSFIDALPTSFPGLNSLRISHNPLFDSLPPPPDSTRALTPEDGYMLTLARLGCLTTLNYSPVTAKERLNAESWYLSLIAKELSFAPKEEEARILKTHPRWAWLCEEYGEPVIERGEDKVNPNSLAARLVRLRVVLEEGKDKKRQTTDLEIPGRCSAYTLLGMVGKAFRIPPMKCRLIWETGDWMPAPGSEEVDEEEWDSESEDGADDEKEKPAFASVMREVEIVPGTRSVATWIEGKEATIRVEVR